MCPFVDRQNLCEELDETTLNPGMEDLEVNDNDTEFH